MDQVRPLLELVERYRLSRCEAALGEARSRAEALLGEAHRQARRRLHAAIVEERQKAQAAIRSAQARLQTARRLREQRRAMGLLDAAWTRLRPELVRRWRDPGARALWVQGLASAALATLPKTGWRIRHPADWPAREIAALEAKLAAQLAAPPDFASDPAIDAGLRIEAGEAIFDGTPEGLLADRRSVEARLLHRLQGRAP